MPRGLFFIFDAESGRMSQAVHCRENRPASHNSLFESRPDMSADSTSVEIRRKATRLACAARHTAQELRRKLSARDFERPGSRIPCRNCRLDGCSRISALPKPTCASASMPAWAAQDPFRTAPQRGDRRRDYRNPARTARGEYWDESMQKQRVRRFGEAIPDDHPQRMKQARFLQNRGFYPEAVMRLFR